MCGKKTLTVWAIPHDYARNIGAENKRQRQAGKSSRIANSSRVT